MRKCFIVLLALALLCATAAAADEAPARDPGQARAFASVSYDTAQRLAEKYGVGLTNGVPLYAPAHPQPLNAYMVTHAECEVGIDYDGMYPVSEKGLVRDITEYLDEWGHEIMTEAHGAIQFVNDPDDADVLVCASQRYTYYGDYRGGGLIATGYSCTIELTAWQLSDPANTFSFSATNTPSSTESLRGGGKFWKLPPKIAGTPNLTHFVEAILGWYGGGAKNGSKGAGVKALQQSLIDRGYLSGSADGSFGPKTEAAVKQLQADYSLDETGEVDRLTLVAAYFNQEAVRNITGDDISF